MILYITGMIISYILGAVLGWKVDKQEVKRMLGKKNKEKELDRAKRLLEAEAALERQRMEQEKETPRISTNAEIAGNQPAAADIENLKEAVQYYGENYRGIFNAAEMPAQTINPMQAEIASLLFGILQELRKIRKGE